MRPKRETLQYLTDCRELVKRGKGKIVNLYEGTVRTTVRIQVDCEPAAKANSRRIVVIDGVSRSIKSPKAMTFSQIAILQARQQYRGPTLTGRLVVHMKIAYSTMLPDLDESVFLDALQGIVYRNDRQIVARVTRRMHAQYGFVQATIDELNPVV